VRVTEAAIPSGTAQMTQDASQNLVCLQVRADSPHSTQAPLQGQLGKSPGSTT